MHAASAAVSNQGSLHQAAAILLDVEGAIKEFLGFKATLFVNIELMKCTK